MAKILISAGEASGDIHAAAVTAAIKKFDSKAEVFGMGGDNLRAAGGEVLWDIKDHGVMGFVEVIKKLPDLFRLRSDFARVMDERAGHNDAAGGLFAVVVVGGQAAACG